MAQFDNARIRQEGFIPSYVAEAEELMRKYPDLFREIPIFDDLKLEVTFADFTTQPGNSYKIFPIGLEAIFRYTQQGVNNLVMGSPGNGGRALATVAQKLGLNASITVPINTARRNIDALIGLGANVEVYGENFDQSQAAARKYAYENEGIHCVEPYNDEHVLIGNGVIGKKLLKVIEQRNIQVIVLPIGGGGFSGGIVSYIKAHRPYIKIIGVQTEQNHAMKTSIESGHFQATKATVSLSHSTAVSNPGELSFEILSDGIDGIVTVSEMEISHAIAYYLAHGRRVEGAGALSLAARIAGKLPKTQGQKTLLLISGANISNEQIQQVYRNENSR